MTIQITDRQLEIIQAAGKILSISGVHGLTIKNLAKEMKFSESAIYRHFRSKEQILVSMLEYVASQMEQRYSNAVDNDKSTEENFKSLFENQFAFFNEHPYFAVAIFSDGLLAESEKINHTILKIMAVKMKYLMPIIMEGQQNGIFTNEITTEEIVHIVMAALRLQMFKWRMANFEFDIVRHGNNIIQSLLTILKTKK